ncbi:MAG: ChaN family lipoprotein [Rubrivivax sp.]
MNRLCRPIALAQAQRHRPLLPGLVLTCGLVGWAPWHAQASTTPSQPTPAQAMTVDRVDLAAAPLVLLGEVHDHPQQHAMRAEAFATLLARGARPALVLEQFDAHRQGEIDRLRAQPGGVDAAALIAQVGGPGWHWPHYRPFIELALRHDLPIVAANVGRDAARAVMRDGLAAHGYDAQVPEDLLATFTGLIERSHCGMIGTAVARRMALAQVARDQSMARALESQSARGAVLLAGNVHVRTDIGVPHWLTPEVRARSVAIGVVEQGDATTAFDQRVVTPPHPRADPCADLRAPAARPTENPR